MMALQCQRATVICGSRTSRELCEVIDSKQPIPPPAPADGTWIEQANPLTDRAQTRSAKFPAVCPFSHPLSFAFPILPASQFRWSIQFRTRKTACKTTGSLLHSDYDHLVFAKRRIGACIGNRRNAMGTVEPTSLPPGLVWQASRFALIH